jgi:N-acetylmuramoyl-L-alanine amidase
MSEKCQIKNTRQLTQEFLSNSPAELVAQPKWHISDPEKSFGRMLHFLFHRKNLWQNSNQTAVIEALRLELLNFFESGLEQKKIWLEQSFNDNPQASRLHKIDKIVLHHTAGDADYWLGVDAVAGISRLNALQFLRLTAYYRSYPLQNKTGSLVFPQEYEKDLNLGRVILNVPELEGVTNFIQYHSLIFPNGKVFRVNQPKEELWNAPGANHRSVAICLIGNFNKQEPGDSQLEALSKEILYYQNRFNQASWLGHREVKRADGTLNPTDCPGDTYLLSWKSKLEQKLEELKNL